MGIGKWNLAGAWSDHHRDLLIGADCDVWLLTEVPSGAELDDYQGHFGKELMAPGRHWAAISGRHELQRLQAAAPVTSTRSRVSGRQPPAGQHDDRATPTAPLFDGTSPATASSPSGTLVRRVAEFANVLAGERARGAVVGEDVADVEGTAGQQVSRCPDDLGQPGVIPAVVVRAVEPV
jgi:hypothetical protein